MKEKFGEQISIEYCHGCGKNMRISLDLDLNGQHEIRCPHCDHPHYRIIKDGKITSERYASYMYIVSSSTASSVSYFSSTSTAGDTYLNDLWNKSANY